jgi:hypothetical protein
MSFWKYLNPLYPVVRLKNDLVSSFRGVSTTLAASKERFEAKRRADEALEGTNEDPSLRFEKSFVQGGFTEETLANQLKAVRRARRWFIVSAYIGTPCFVSMGMFSPWWISMFVLPCAIFFCVLLFILAAKHAWFEWQITERSFKSFQQFMSLRDFFARVMIP